MPLCSCGVVPTAIGLRNQGASKGATTSFLISTPQTGVDSVLVCASFLGWPFALFKLAAAFATGVFGGWLVNGFTSSEPKKRADAEQGDTWKTGANRLTEVFRYALFDLLGTIDLWLIGGILIAAAIAAAVPPEYFQQVAWVNGLGGMLLVLAVALPLYVCTTASVPIAASLIAAGMPAGSALVFLMAGPATNVATMGAIYRALGVRVLSLYLGTVIVASIGLGMTFDSVLGDVSTIDVGHEHGSAAWWQTGSALLLIALLIFLLGRRLPRFSAASSVTKETNGMDLTLKVKGMTCPHCVANVKNALESVETVQRAEPDLATGLVRVKGKVIDQEALTEILAKAGYTVMPS
jgi:uncharacterized membrane protein YraQ (UPF0718 family)/copper chaperone CopZ